MNRFMSSVTNFLERHGVIETQRPFYTSVVNTPPIAEEWDSVSNEERQEHTLYSLENGTTIRMAESVNNAVAGSSIGASPMSWAVDATTFQGLTSSIEAVPMNTHPTISLSSAHSDYTNVWFELGNNHTAEIKILDNNEGLEIAIDTNIFEPIIEDGKIRFIRMYDEENNASQDTRTHETSIENSVHGSPNMLLGRHTVINTQT